MIARALAAALALAAAFAVPVRAERPAQPAVEAAIADAVPGHPGLTYAALLKLALPDLAEGEDGIWTGTPAGPLRTPDGQPGVAETLTFRSVETLEILSDGRPIRLVMTNEMQDGVFTTLLAAYDLEGASPALVDAVDAGLDRWTALSTTLPLAEGMDAVIVSGSHVNAGENYEVTSVLLLRKGRFAAICTQLAYSAMTGDWQSVESLAVAAEPDPGAPYSAVAVSVTVETTRLCLDCAIEEGAPAPGRRVYGGRFRWDAAAEAYAPAGGDLAEVPGPE